MTDSENETDRVINFMNGDQVVLPKYQIGVQYVIKKIGEKEVMIF
jgi:hypothetical protein